MKGLAVLGSTGSIGTQTLDVARAFPGDLRVVALAARRSAQLLEEQVREFRPRLVYCEGTSREMVSILDGGAVQSSMVEMALENLSKRQIVELDEERKAAMVSNLLVVLCGDRATQPVVNTGTLHQ